MAKNNKIIFFDRIRILLFVLLVISGLIPFVNFNYPYIITTIIFFLLAIFELSYAIYFKQSLEYMGIAVGQKNNSYLYWGVTRFILFAIFGGHYYFIYKRVQDQTFLVYGVLVWMLSLLAILIYTKSHKK